MSLSRPAARGAWSVALAALVWSGSAGDARAQSASKATCIADFERAAELRSDGKLLDARQRLLECGSLRCPAAVQKECAKELDLLDHSLPSIVIALRDEAGHDLVDARALVDGAAQALDGRALPLDPGRHTIRFEIAGCEPNEQLVLLAEGEKNRAIIGIMRCGGTEAPRSAGQPPGAPSTPPSSAPVPSRAPRLVLPLVLAGAGVVSLAGFAYFGVRGSDDLDDIRSTGCAPSCDREAVTQARTKLLVADVMGAVGLVSLGAAAWLVVSGWSSARTASAVSLDLRPVPSGGAMLVRARF